MTANDDLELFEQSLRRATSTNTGPALDASLEELGWHDALVVETQAAVSVLFQLQGEANATSSALDHVLAHTIGHRGPVVLPAIGDWNPPGVLTDGGLVLNGLGTASLRSAQTAVVVAGNVACSIDPQSLTLRPVDGMDPAIGLLEATGTIAAPTDIWPIDWSAAIALGQLALGHELVGACRQMLELARQHALDRVQFGQPIARFQAVRHRLSESLVAIETADALLDAAWIGRDPQAAAMAKALAGRSARTTARHCQQVLAGIGFTTEHPLHQYVKRVLVLEQLLGSTRRLTQQLGKATIDSQTLPELVPL